MLPRDSISTALRTAKESGRPAVVAFLTAGFPTREKFPELLLDIASQSDVIEIGVPFTDPMADGTTVQRSSRVALEQGVSLRWIFTQLEHLQPRVSPPLL